MSLLSDVQEIILATLSTEDLFHLKVISKSLKEIIEGEKFQIIREGTYPIEGSYTALHFFIRDEADEDKPGSSRALRLVPARES